MPCRLRALSVGGSVGIVVGLVAAVLWHVLVTPVSDPEMVGTPARAYETALKSNYAPAPPWTPTIIAFPLLSAVLLGVVGLLTVRHWADHWSAVRAAVGGGAAGAVVGICVVLWSRISPPVFQALTESRPWRIEIENSAFLWLIVPIVCAAAAGALITLLHRSFRGYQRSRDDHSRRPDHE